VGTLDRFALFPLGNAPHDRHRLRRRERQIPTRPVRIAGTLHESIIGPGMEAAG
jgi:hypothetical protein